MNPKVLLRVLAILTILISMTSCKKTVRIDKLDDLDGKIIGVLTGTAIDELVSSAYPKAKFRYFNNTNDAIEALRMKRVDAVVEDEPLLKIIVASNNDLRVLTDMITYDDYAFALAIDEVELHKQVDDIISQVIQSGKYKEMLHRWFPEYRNERVLPEFNLVNKNGTLLFGTSSITEPFSYIDGSGNIVGIDIELAYRIAEALQMDIEIRDMQFGALIPSLMSHRVQLIGGCITITPERAEKILFTQPLYHGGVGVLVRR